jgi:hypothetical protein
MCRNIRVLYNFKPPTTQDEIHAAALQYVRKVSGLNKPSEHDEKAFEKAIAKVAAATQALLESLEADAPVRTREGEKLKAKERWKKREAQLAQQFGPAGKYSTSEG